MRLLLSLALALVPTAALAHAGDPGTSGFLHGLEHPFGGLDHVIAMLAVGILAFVLGGRALYLVPLAFVGMMAAGFLLGAGGVGLPFVEFGIALSVVAIGGAAALGRPLPLAAAMALVGGFAVFHGQAHGTEMPAGSSGLFYALGFVLATASLHAAGLLAALGATRLIGRHGRLLTRLSGGIFALGGVGLLAGWL